MWTAIQPSKRCVLLLFWVTNVIRIAQTESYLENEASICNINDLEYSLQMESSQYTIDSGSVQKLDLDLDEMSESIRTLKDTNVIIKHFLLLLQIVALFA